MAREVCQHAGSKAIVAGLIDLLHNDYILGLKAIDCDSGNVLAEVQERVPDKGEVLKALDEATTVIRQQMGEPVSSVRRYSMTPEGSTQSLEAWKAYTTGVKIQNTEGITASIPVLNRAV